MNILIVILGIINIVFFVGCYLRLDDPDGTPIKMWREIWKTRNIFGKACSTIMIILTMPGIIAFYLLFLLYGIYIFIQYMGLKKHS